MLAVDVWKASASYSNFFFFFFLSFLSNEVIVLWWCTAAPWMWKICSCQHSVRCLWNSLDLSQASASGRGKVFVKVEGWQNLEGGGMSITRCNRISLCSLALKHTPTKPLVCSQHFISTEQLWHFFFSVNCTLGYHSSTLGCRSESNCVR